MLPGSGTPATGTPGISLAISAVPKENVTPVIVVSDVTFGAVRVNEADWLRNGLCGLFPAIEPLAAL